MVSAQFLEKIRFSLRRSENAKVDAEIVDLIEQCRADLMQIGIPKEVASDEANPLVTGCVRSFVRWQFGLGTTDGAVNRADYEMQADCLRKNL